MSEVVNKHINYCLIHQTTLQNEDHYKYFFSWVMTISWVTCSCQLVCHQVKWLQPRCKVPRNGTNLSKLISGTTWSINCEYIHELLLYRIWLIFIARYLDQGLSSICILYLLRSPINLFGKGGLLVPKELFILHNTFFNSLTVNYKTI